ncbi:MAG: hypothetical protein IPN76_31955 [Saprospiraceae bacterium]|nr:hypothetical protein [Saprospiraceae bacterium]
MNPVDNTSLEENKKRAKIYLVIGIILMIVAPAIIGNMSFDLISFDSNSSNVGETIGGITSPIGVVLSSILIYLALIEQIRANKTLSSDIAEQKKQYENDKKIAQINSFLSQLDGFVIHFNYNNQEILKNTDSPISFSGPTGIYHFLKDVRTFFHGSVDELERLHSYNEFLGIVRLCTIIEGLISNLADDSDRLAHNTLLKHQVKFKILSFYATDGMVICEASWRNEDFNTEHHWPSELLNQLNNLSIKLKI